MDATAAVYRGVMEDVIRNVRTEFSNAGLDDSVLTTLLQYWEGKMTEMGVLGETGTAEGVEGQGSDYYGGQSTYGNAQYEYQQNNVPDPHQHSYYTQQQSGGSYNYQDYSQQQGQGGTGGDAAATPYYQGGMPASGTDYDATGAQGQTFGQGYNQAGGNSGQGAYGSGSYYQYVDNTNQPPSNQGNIPQNDGAADECVGDKSTPASSSRQQCQEVDARIGKMIENKRKFESEEPIPQTDGGDDDDDLGSDDDTNDELNSDDDEDGDGDSESGEEEAQSYDLVLALFDKVSRSKNKWKASLKEGIMNLGGQDYLFHKAQGEFDW